MYEQIKLWKDKAGNDINSDSRKTKFDEAVDGAEDYQASRQMETDLYYIKDKKINTTLEQKLLILEGAGYKLLKEVITTGDSHQVIRIKNNVLQYKLKKDIRNDIRNDWMHEYPADLMEYIKKNVMAFKDGMIDLLPLIDSPPVLDTKEQCFIPYLNGVLEITKDSTKLIEYKDFNKVIMEKHIVKREYIEKQSGEIGDWEKFIIKLSTNPQTDKLDEIALKSIKEAIGYLIHTYNNPSFMKAVIITEDVEDMDPSGRSGKGLIGESIGHIRNRETIDGKNIKFSSPHWSDNVNLLTQCVVFDDTRKEFPFEVLFNFITGGYQVEPKGKHKIVFTPENNPKTIITTNHPPAGLSMSDAGRRINVSIYKHYTDKHQPEEDFGKQFFNGWTGEYKSEWQYFDEFIHGCVKLYLTSKTVTDRNPKSVKARQIAQEINFGRRSQFASLDMLGLFESLTSGIEYTAEMIRNKAMIFFDENNPDKLPRSSDISVKLQAYAKAMGDDVTLIIQKEFNPRTYTILRNPL